MNNEINMRKLSLYDIIYSFIYRKNKNWNIYIQY